MLADASDSDPDLLALADMLAALWLLTGGRDFLSKDVVRWVREGEYDEPEGVRAMLRSAVMDLVGTRGADFSPRSMGRVLEHRRGRVAQGYKVLARSGPAGRDGKVWRVVRVGDA